MLSYAAILKNEKQKQKTPENKNEEPERRREINRNFQQQNDQPTPLNKQTHHERYKDIRVLPYHWEITKHFQAASTLINGELMINSRTCLRDATSYTSYRKLKDTLGSTLKTKLGPFKNVVNLSNKTCFRSELSITKT